MSALTWRPAKPGETPGQLTPELSAKDGFYDDEPYVEDWEPWTVEAEDASWLADDDRARRREDR